MAGYNNPYEEDDEGRPPRPRPQGSNYGGYPAPAPAVRPTSPSNGQLYQAGTRAENQGFNALDDSRASLIRSLERTANGKGQAYGQTMREVKHGNARLGGLASTGRGSVASVLNSQNAARINVAAGHQGGLAAKADEQARARQALANVIGSAQSAQGAREELELNVIKGTPDAKNPLDKLAVPAQVGQAAWDISQSGGGGDDDEAKRRNRASYNGGNY
ncbi:MAG: hypothetical protein IPL79_20130 [Myxococcales bacterium]|nr:hypothetical protein [Myxococcales bacterium]